MVNEKIRQLRDEGYSAKQVAEMIGISRARVYQASRAKRLKQFKEIAPETNVYPIWRNWMNENSVSARMLVQMMGLDLSSATYSSLYGWMQGRCYPSKKNIDRLLETTGLTYEQLFALEEVG